MPGVPSGRGCDACRKLKKKCDLGQPACSRCTRLRIPCIGCGKRRFKFKDQTSELTSTAVTFSPQAQRTPSPAVPRLGTPKVLSNELTSVAKALCNRLDVTDVRYDLTWYGEFLKEIPRRLGKNEALDAAATAFTATFHALDSSRAPASSMQVSSNALHKYGLALKALRHSLEDADKASTADTLCAIYLIIVCQSWLGWKKNSIVSHGLAIAHILSHVDFSSWTSQFESELLVTLTVPVIFEGIFSTGIKYGPWLWNLISTYAPFDSDIIIHTLQLERLAQIASYIRQPELHVFELMAAYQQINFESPLLRARLDQIIAAAAVDDVSAQHLPNPMPWPRIISRVRIGYTFLLTFSTVINLLLRAFNPYDSSLVIEATALHNELFAQAEHVSKYRPLGASYMPFFLVLVWAASDDPVLRKNIEYVVTDYQKDLFIEATWMDTAEWVSEQFEHLRQRIAAPRLHADMTCSMAGATSGGEFEILPYYT